MCIFLEAAISNSNHSYSSYTANKLRPQYADKNVDVVLHVELVTLDIHFKR